MRVQRQLIHQQHTLTGKQSKAWLVQTPQKDKIIDLWRRKCRCGSAHNAFIPHYVAAIQYSEHDLGKKPGMQCGINERHKVLKTRTIVVLRLLTDCCSQCSSSLIVKYFSHKHQKCNLAVITHIQSLLIIIMWRCYLYPPLEIEPVSFILDLENRS